ncbi:uncharacterized protein [Gossypium hirsutum]|uniref:Uncharacterized protein n=1 Tax=Gossypium hirsutum TaxID=3635 RepID=A0A1U8KYC9_GOSHI|nr:uncharacterized protein LOC107922098 [Gossypium hirsutum]
MPPRHVNMKAGAQEDDTSSAPPVAPRKVNILDEGRKYMGEQYMDARKREFLDLIQGYLSVANYKVGFLQLSQYAPKMILPERDCCKWFYFGINHEIRVYLVSQPIEVFDELVERARAVEETLAEPPRSMVTNSGKRASDSASGRSSKRGCDSHVVLDGRFVCTVSVGILESVVEFGGPTRAYVVRELEDQDSIDVFAGMTVIGSLGDSVLVDKVYHRCPLMIQGHVFLVDIMELSFYGFDVIFGMDWLTEHKARVDFETKWITLRNSEELEIVVVGERPGFMSNVVLAMNAEKLMEELPSLPPDREVEFWIDLYSSTASLPIAPYCMTPKELKELKIQLQELFDTGFI